MDPEPPQPLLREMADAIPGFVFQLRIMRGQAPRYTYVSPYVETLHGVSREAVLADAGVVSSLVVPEDQPRLAQVILTALRDQRPAVAQFRSRHADGHVIWQRLVATVRAVDGGLIVNGCSVDVTAEIEAELKLQEAERRMREITGSLPGMVYEIVYSAQSGSRWTYASGDIAGLYGVTREEVLSDPQFLSRYVPMEDRARMLQEVMRAPQDGRTLTFDFPIQHPDGRKRWLRTHLTRQLTPDGGVRMNGYTVDVTEAKAVEAELAHAKEVAVAASRAKSDFLAHMSHEIRTPMNAVLGFAYLGLQAGPGPPLRDYFARIEGAARGLLDIVNDVLDLSKVEAGKLELERTTFALAQVLDNVASVVGQRAQEKGLQFRVEVAPDVPPALVGDPLRLGQVLLNLGGNAAKFTERGEVVIGVRRGAAAAAGEHLLEFSVRDTGIGLTHEQIARVFDAFSQADSSTTRRYGGTGLGLSICRHLVQLMGGELFVDSAPGAGSTFRFSARLGVAAAAPEAVRASAVDPAQLAGLSVLVVDDHEVNRDIVRSLLDAVGVGVQLAQSGPEAIAAAAAARFDAIFMDLSMPGMDGLEAARRIRAQEAGGTRAPIIALTANVMAPDRERCLAGGMDDFVGKPIDVNALFAALARVRHGMPAPAAAPAPVDFDFPAARARFGHQPDLFDRLAARFPDDAAHLRGEMARGPPAAAALGAHTLKGLAAQLGALALARLAAGLEAALATRPATATELAALDAAIADARARLAAGIPEPAAAPAPPPVMELVVKLSRQLENDDDDAYDTFEALHRAVAPAQRTRLEPLRGPIASLDYAQALVLWREVLVDLR